MEVDGVFARDDVLEGRACLALQEERDELHGSDDMLRQYLCVFLGALEREKTELSETRWVNVFNTYDHICSAEE